MFPDHRPAMNRVVPRDATEAPANKKAEVRRDAIHRVESAEAVLQKKGSSTLEAYSVCLTLRLLVLSILSVGSCSVARSQAIPGSQAAGSAPAAVNKPSDPLNRESPQSSMVAFLEACHAHENARAGKYLDLRDSSAEQRAKDGPELARQLEQILDRDAQCRRT